MYQNELDLVNVIINYTDTFINKLKNQRRMIDEHIDKLTEEKKKRLQHRFDKWGIPLSDPYNIKKEDDDTSRSTRNSQDSTPQGLC